MKAHKLAQLLLAGPDISVTTNEFISGPQMGYADLTVIGLEVKQDEFGSFISLAKKWLKDPSEEE